MKTVQVEDKSSVKFGDLELRNNTGTAIKVVLDETTATVDVVACCIGERSDH